MCIYLYTSSLFFIFWVSVITGKECGYSDTGLLSLNLVFGGVRGAFVGFIFLSEEGGERNLVGDFEAGECYSAIGFLSLDLVFRGGEGFE